MIDLTHRIHRAIPIWPNSTIFTTQIRQEFSPENHFRVYDYCLAAGTGTHMDAPSHCVQSGKSIADFELSELIGPGCIIDISASVSDNPDYAITVEDLRNWENNHGTIPPKAIFLANTGWSKYWSTPLQYINADSQGQLHFPGFSESAAQWLVNRRILGVGIDTLSIDCGISQTYPAHQVFLNHGLFQLENLTNLDKLPPTGAMIFALPIKIENAPEAPARVIAMII